MKAASLFAACVLAKILVLADRQVPMSAWTPLAYFWQDALVALLLAALERGTRGQPWIAGSAFGFAIIYLAINVPLTRALSSPFTWQMSQAAGGALADSIRHYLTWANCGLIAVILLAGILLPKVMQRFRPGVRAQRMGLLGSGVLITLGPFASMRVDCAGLDRSVYVAFVMSALPRVHLEPGNLEHMAWRVSPLTSGPSAPPTTPNLSRLRGSAARRNVVMVALESTGVRSLRCYGAADDPMPNLTRLASTSLLFENVYSVSPESIKGLFSVLCSRYPAFDVSPAAWARVSTPSLAQMFHQAGYRTGLFHSGRFMYLGMESVVRNRGFQVLEDAGAIAGNVQSSFGVDEPATVQRALAWIDSLPRGEPFFLTYLPIAGHHPYATPEPGPFPEKDEHGQYLNALRYSDEALGALWRGLNERALGEQTLLVVYGDHGEAFGEHEGNYGHTQFLYEENVRVPCLMVAPGWLPSPMRVPGIWSLIDLAPTILDLVGIVVPPDYQGISMLGARDQMALFYTDYSLPLVGLRDGPWKFVHELGVPHSKLFHLIHDPAERTNLAAGDLTRVEAYRERLQRWSRAQKGQLTLEAETLFP